jgi:hypothetical protein
MGRKFRGGSLLSTTKAGTATFYQSGDRRNSSGFGSTNQVFRFGGMGASRAMPNVGDVSPDIELYFRNVSAVNGSVVSDQERVAGSRAAEVSAQVPISYGGPRGVFSPAPVDGWKGPSVFMGRWNKGRVDGAASDLSQGPLAA